MTCSSGKICYTSKKQAKQLAKHKCKAAYKCDECGFFHTSSMSRVLYRKLKRRKRKANDHHDTD